MDILYHAQPSLDAIAIHCNSLTKDQVFDFLKKQLIKESYLSGFTGKADFVSA